MACRSKTALFGDAAPIWRFLNVLGATEDPEQARIADYGLFIIEVFPALALPAFNVKFWGIVLGQNIIPITRNSFGKATGAQSQRPSRNTRVPIQSRK